MKEKLITIEIPSGYAVRNISEDKITLEYLYPRTFSECVEELGLQPTAMDVYQNKTTLEYKVVDDVKVDSVVIFKEEFKK